MKAQTLLGYLICVCGLVALLLVVVTPYMSVRNKDADHAPAKHLENRSSIRFSEKTIRLASAHSGEIASGSVLVKNVGNAVITSAAVKASCTCSDVKLSDTTIKPGTSIKIDFSIDTRGKYGDFAEHLLFTYSENGRDMFDTFSVTVPILAPGKIVAEPSSLQFNKAKVGEVFSRNITLRAKDLPESETVEIIDIAVPDWIAVNLAKQDAGWLLTLSGVFPKQSGRYVEFVRIKSNSERYSEMIIPVIIEYAAIPADDAVVSVETGE